MSGKGLIDLGLGVQMIWHYGVEGTSLVLWSVMDLSPTEDFVTVNRFNRAQGKWAAKQLILSWLSAVVEAIVCRVDKYWCTCLNEQQEDFL
jgi:hypothetical protein